MPFVKKLFSKPRLHSFLYNYGILLLISLFLFIIPFFWLKPGEMDLGGDSSRLYFYDPLSYLKNAGLYVVMPVGMGSIQPNYYFLPFVGLLVVLKYILKSPYLLITLFNSFKLIVSFLCVYLITKEILYSYKNNLVNFFASQKLSSMLAGLLYVFISSMTINWDKALITHNQIFLNPLMFYLLMRYFITKNGKYMWSLIVITILFAPNFSWIAAPALLSFYPLSLLFLFLYNTFTLRKKIPWKASILSIFFLFGLHTFHLVPQIINLFDPGSLINTRVFDKQRIINEGVRYFQAILPLAKVSLKILVPPDFSLFNIYSIMVPLFVLIGLVVNKGKNKTILLTTIFFIVTLFLLTAKITNMGVFIYQKLFYIPGFSVFRNFIGQWLFVYSFFYSLLFGQAIFLVFSKFKKRPTYIFFGLIALIVVTQAWLFINGSIINHKLFRSDKYIAIKMDPDYETTLHYISNLPDDGKILTLPLTDFYFQMLAGKNNGVYQGPSTISYIAGKKDFAGYADLNLFAEVFLKLAKNKDYANLKNLLAILNIKYIFYNNDKNIYDDAFPSYPYEYVRNSLPTDQKSYADFIKQIVGKKVYQKGNYTVYETDNSSTLPILFTSKKMISYQLQADNIDGNYISFFLNSGYSLKDVYVDKSTCEKEKLKSICDKTNFLTPAVSFKKINNTKYKVEVLETKHPFVLVFSELFNNSWKVFISKEAQAGKNKKNNLFDSNIFETIQLKSISEVNHFKANGYANGWYINSEEIQPGKKYELIIEMTQQRGFIISFIISLLFLIGFAMWGMQLFLFKKTPATIRNYYGKSKKQHKNK